MSPQDSAFLHDLIEVSRRVAAQGPLWIQGAGGNISFKDRAQSKMWIKATGFRLSEITIFSGVVSLDFQKLAKELRLVQTERDYAAALSKFLLDGGDRFKASMEAGFHALLPRKWVLHFHSCEALLMHHVRSKDPDKFAHWLSRSKWSFEFLPQLLPGLEITRALDPGNPKDVYILQNHGVILHAGEANALEEWRRLAENFCEEFGYASLNILRGKSAEAFAKNQGQAFDLKIYFPDTAVFYLELAALKGILPVDYLEKERSLFEICLATQWLYEFCPQLEEWPLEKAAQIAKLPTEALRLNQLKKKGVP